MDNGDRQLLVETHGAVMEVKGALPHLATKNDVVTAVRQHETTRHTVNKKWLTAKTKLVGAITTFIILAGSLLAAWKWG
jgi:hypothetical protein